MNDETYDRIMRYAWAVTGLSWTGYLYGNYFVDISLTDKLFLSVLFSGTLGILSYIILLMAFELYSSDIIPFIKAVLNASDEELDNLITTQTNQTTQVERPTPAPRVTRELPPDVAAVHQAKLTPAPRHGRVQRRQEPEPEVEDDDDDDESEIIINESRQPREPFVMFYDSAEDYIRAKIQGQWFTVGNVRYEYIGLTTYLKGVITYYWHSGETYFSRTAIADHHGWPRLDKNVDSELTKLENWMKEKELLTPYIVSNNRKQLTEAGESAFPSPSR